MSEEKMEEIDQLIEAGQKKSEIARQVKISRETLYRYLRSKNTQEGSTL